MKRQSPAARDRKIAAADKHLLEAARLLADAIDLDERLELPDRIGAMDLARASDAARRAAKDITYWLEHARIRRVDHDRAVAAERAAGGPEAYARQRGLA